MSKESYIPQIPQQQPPPQQHVVYQPHGCALQSVPQQVVIQRNVIQQRKLANCSSILLIFLVFQVLFIFIFIIITLITYVFTYGLGIYLGKKILNDSSYYEDVPHKDKYFNSYLIPFIIFGSITFVIFVISAIILILSTICGCVSGIGGVKNDHSISRNCGTLYILSLILTGISLVIQSFGLCSVIMVMFCSVIFITMVWAFCLSGLGTFIAAFACTIPCCIVAGIHVNNENTNVVNKV